MHYAVHKNTAAEVIFNRVDSKKENARRAGTTATFDQLNKYFGITQMPIISSRY